MPERCRGPRCHAPEVGCALGHLDLGECPEWKGGAVGSAVAPGAEDGQVPWSGGALGSSDLGFVAGRARPLLLGIIGPQNAGKTTLLAAWYLLIARGALAGSGTAFAGSFSLTGWEAIAASLRWAPGQPPAFPAHTTSRGQRMPGLLHLAHRVTTDRRARDILFTDAPGEWFQRWAVDRDAPGALGARWIAERADAALLVADREALAGGGMGAARNAIQLLARRLAAERRGRPVALVWTKGDVAVEPAIEDAVRRAVLGPMPDVPEFSVGIPIDHDARGSERSFTDLLRWVLALRRPAVALPEPAGSTTDPLFLVGTRA